VAGSSRARRQCTPCWRRCVWLIARRHPAWPRWRLLVVALPSFLLVRLVLAGIG
jgi:hypothetical protein